VKRAQDWPWSSLHARLSGPETIRDLLSDWPIDRPRNWVQTVNRPQSDEEVDAIRTSAKRGRPLGSEAWVARVAARYDLQSTLRQRGAQPGWNRKKSG